MVTLRWLVLSLLLALSSASSPEGEAYLASHKLEEGVVTLPSGLQYRVLESGSGQFHPTPSSPCRCHYQGTLISGEEFDSSIRRGQPATFAPNQVIKGWTEAMQLMVEGDKWELTIPSELAYGDRGSPPKIPGGAVLKFTLEMIEITGDKVPAARCIPSDLERCTEKEIRYIEQIPSKFPGEAALSQEIERLSRLAQSGSSMKADLMHWIHSRINILSHSRDEL